MIRVAINGFGRIGRLALRRIEKTSSIEKTNEMINNTFSEKEQAMYDRAAISLDIRNQCFLWSAIMLAGTVLSLVLSPYMAILAFIVWGILFFKDTHMDAHKAFEKYLLK